MWRIRKAISEATSLEEVEHLTKLLQAGQIPNKNQKKKSGTQNGGDHIIICNNKKYKLLIYFIC